MTTDHQQGTARQGKERLGMARQGEARTTARYLETRPVMDAAIRFAKATFARHVETDALEDVAISAFLYVDKVWDESHGASFTHFLRLCLKHRLYNISNRKARQYSLGKASARSVAVNLHITDELAAFVPDHAPAPDNTEEVLARVKRGASRKAYQLAVALLAEDRSVAQARRELKLSVDEARRLMNEVAQATFDLEPLTHRELVPGMKLVAHYRGKVYHAEVVQSWLGLWCRVGARYFRTLSAAGSAIRHGKATNGWDFFALVHEDELAKKARGRRLIGV